MSNRYNQIIFTFSLLSSMIFSQHYTVDLVGTGVSQLTIFSDTITGLEVGDEIGVFDSNGVLESCIPEEGCNPSTDTQYGELLVGAGVWTGEQLNIVSIVSADNSSFGGPILNGAVTGNSVMVRVWRNSEPMEYGSELTWGTGTGEFGDIIQSVSEMLLTDPNACEDDDAAVAAFGGCAGAVAALGCDFVFGGVPISESCPVSCDACPDEPIFGCTDMSACNYNAEATQDDGSCEEFDCADECGGVSVEDECGVCDGDGIADGACDCDGNVLDCTNECGGDAIIDGCGICNGENIYQDCNGDCFGEAYLDDCDECVGGATGIEECSANIDISMDLHAGANLVSFYAIPDDNSLYNTMGSLDDVMIGVIGEGLAANLLPNGTWVGSLSGISETSGYWVKIEDDANLSISNGIPLDPNLIYDLHSGANLISYPSNISMSVGDAISDEYSNLIDGVIGEGEAASLLPNGTWVGSLTQFRGGNGYWFKASEDFDFNFNIEDEELTRSINILPVQKYPDGMSYTQSMNQAFYFVEDIIIDGSSIKSGAWVLAYNRDVLVGARQWDGKYVDVPAMGFDSSFETIGYLSPGDNIRIEVLDLNGEMHILSGDMPKWENNQIFYTGILTNIDLPKEVSIASVYPNPFNPVTNIEFGLNNSSEVNVSVYDVNGRFVEVLTDNQFNRGFHSINWNASGYPSGIYFVRIISGDTSISQKLVLMK